MESVQSARAETAGEGSVITKIPFAEADIELFRAAGFLARPAPFLSADFVKELQFQLERMIRHDYDELEGQKRGGGKPDKPCRLVKAPLPTHPSGKTQLSQDRQDACKKKKAQAPLGFSGNHDNVKILQLVNVWKCSSVFEQLVLSPILGEFVGRITGWPSVRVTQDQTWLKPPSAGALGFHKDRGYFMLRRRDDGIDVAAGVDAFDDQYLNGVRVVTMWLALDKMDEEIGPLEYAKGSHRWGKTPGTNNNFFVPEGDGGAEGFRHLVLQAARSEPSVSSADDGECASFISFPLQPPASLRVHTCVTC